MQVLLLGQAGTLGGRTCMSGGGTPRFAEVMTWALYEEEDRR